MTESNQHETDEKSGDDSGSTDSCRSTDNHGSTDNSEPTDSCRSTDNSDSTESVSNDGDTQVPSSVADNTATQQSEDVRTVPVEEHKNDPTTEQSSVADSAEGSVSRTAKSAANRSTEPHEAEAAAEADQPGSEPTRVVDAPIPEVEMDEPVERDEYVDRLETKVSELEETVNEKQATVEELRTVRPGLDDMHTEPIATDRYIETLENHVNKLDAELDRKKSVIQELKNQHEEFRKETREETTQTLLSEFFTHVREPLVRGTEQIDDIPDGMKTTIVQFDNLLKEYDGEVIDPTPGDEVDRDTHQVRRKEPGNFADGSVKSVEERGLRVAGTIVKQPAVVLTDGTPDETHTETDNKPPSDEAVENHDGECEHSSTAGPHQDESNANNGRWIDNFES